MHVPEKLNPVRLRMISENLRGAVLMILSMAFFAFEDMFVKLLTMGLPYSQVLTLVGFFGFLVFWGALKVQGKPFWTRDLLLPIVLLRTLGEGIGALGFVIALALTDLSSTSAILQALPLFIVLGAALFLREPVGWRRMTAIGVGFLGVLLIVRPGLSGFQPVSILALISVLGLALRDLATRGIPQHVPSNQIAAAAFFAIMLAGLPLMPIMGQRFTMVTGVEALYFVGSVIFGVAGYVALVSATRVGEASALAPYRYARLVFALIIAYIVFNERPDWLTLLGSMIIVSSGCYTMWRQAQLRRHTLQEAGLEPH